MRFSTPPPIRLIRFVANLEKKIWLYRIYLITWNFRDTLISWFYDERILRHLNFAILRNCCPLNHFNLAILSIIFEAKRTTSFIITSEFITRAAVKGLHENVSNKVLTISTRILRLFVNFSQLTMISMVVCVNSSFLHYELLLIYCHSLNYRVMLCSRHSLFALL